MLVYKLVTLNVTAFASGSTSIRHLFKNAMLSRI